MTYGSTDDFGFNVVTDRVNIHDLQAPSCIVWALTMSN